MLLSNSRTISFSDSFSENISVSPAKSKIDDDNDHRVKEFYSHLFSQQEPLGAEFEKALHANLWNLYES
jgi:hypothetical protein